jgi:hypothetical protein
MLTLDRSVGDTVLIAALGQRLSAQNFEKLGKKVIGLHEQVRYSINKEINTRK